MIVQTLFFGFSILKVNYTTPLLMEYNYSNGIIALSTLVGVIPLIILMPLFGKIFNKFKYTSIILFCILVNILQTTLFILYPENLTVILVGSFLTVFIFPLYSPTFGLFLRKALDHKFVSSGFTVVFTVQNVFIFLFNQFFVINVLNITNTVTSAFTIILICFVFSLVPIIILKFKNY